MNAGFSSSSDHDIGVAECYEPRCVADGVGASGAGCGDGVVGALG